MPPLRYPRLTRLASVLATSLLLAACAEDRTAIRLVVESDLAIGLDLDGLELEMSREGAQIWATSIDLAEGGAFPVERSIRPTSEVDDQVAITVGATLGRRRGLTATRTVGFDRGSVIDLRICLLRECLGSEEERCRQGRCPDEVSDGDADADAEIDSGPDGTDADAAADADGADGLSDGSDGGTDGGRDAAPDAGTDAADGDVDDGLVCLETCATAGDGLCQDGAEGALSMVCDHGTDCADCGGRPPLLCTDDCALARNGLCEDGGLGSSSGLCDLGEDCADCGARSASLCNDSCPFALDGQCQDGGEGSDYRWCPFGADCVDCGARDPLSCEPDCVSRDCGDDGCGGSCGSCDGSEECAPGGACIDWARIEATTFWMGSPEEEVGRPDFSDEDLREVTLTRDYLLSPTEVHQRWFFALMRRAPSIFSSCDRCPVEEIDWNTSAFFCNVLSVIEGLERCFDCTGRWPSYDCALAATLDSPYDCSGYRLPTEAEWENAARAGTTTATYNGDLELGFLACEPENPTLDSIAWFCGNATAPHPVGTKTPNAWGLYDMQGNCPEAVHDWYVIGAAGDATDPFGPVAGAYRTLRGCGFDMEARYCRAAPKSYTPPDAELGHTFRPARTAP